MLIESILCKVKIIYYWRVYYFVFYVYKTQILNTKPLSSTPNNWDPVNYYIYINSNFNRPWNLQWYKKLSYLGNHTDLRRLDLMKLCNQ